MIREFDLVAPTKEKAVRLRFRNETRCVTALYERCYAPSRATGKPWKILVEVVDLAEDASCRDLLGVLTVQVSGDVAAFFQLDARAKMEKALDYLELGISKVADQNEWDMIPFREAADEVRRRDFVNEWIWKSPVLNRSKSLSAEILVEHQLSEARLSVRFRDRDDNIVKVVCVVCDERNEFVFHEYLGALQWVDDSTVELVSRRGDNRFPAHAV